MSAIDRLMAGAIDMHVHFGPDSSRARRQDAIQVARSAREAGMRAIVLKNREYMTVPIAILANQFVPEISVFGGITLDNDIGGLNPGAVLTAARTGAKVVWMPTVSAANSQAKAAASLGHALSGPGISILDASGDLLPAVKEVMKIVKEHDIVLATGHLSAREVNTLAGEAKAAGLSKILVTHALQPHHMESILTVEELRILAQDGVFIEISFWGWMPAMLRDSPRQLADAMKAIGAVHCIISTDFGQEFNPPAPEGLRMFVSTLLRMGFGEDEVEEMVKTNPAFLLGIK